MGTIGQNRLMEFVFRLDSRRIVWALTAVVLLLTAASLIGQYSTYFLVDGHMNGFVAEFNLNRETNVPTWFSSFQFLFIALLLWKVGKSPIGHPRHWRALSVFFVFLSIDEVAAFHEMAMDPFQGWFQANGHPYYGWVIPRALVVAVVAGLCLRVFLRLPPKVKRIFLLATTLFLGGTLGLKMAGGFYIETHGVWDFTYALIANAEGFLKMLGQVLYLHGLFSLLKTEEIPPKKT